LDLKWQAKQSTNRDKTVSVADNKNPAIAVSKLSLEHVLQHVELAGLFSTSSEGMSATTATHPVIVLITVQGLFRITNRAG